MLMPSEVGGARRPPLAPRGLHRVKYPGAATSPQLWFWAEPGHLDSFFSGQILAPGIGALPPPTRTHARNHVPTINNPASKILKKSGTRPRESFSCRAAQVAATEVSPWTTSDSRLPAFRFHSPPKSLVQPMAQSPLLQAH